MARLTAYIEMSDEEADLVPQAELEAGLEARLDEVYVNVPGEDGHPLTSLHLVGVDIEDD